MPDGRQLPQSSLGTGPSSRLSVCLGYITHPTPYLFILHFLPPSLSVELLSVTQPSNKVRLLIISTNIQRFIHGIKQCSQKRELLEAKELGNK